MFLASTIFAQSYDDANVTGYLVDKNSNIKIPYLYVSVNGTTIGTTSDVSGFYKLIKIPPGEQTITVSGLGYKTINKKFYYTPGKKLNLDIEVEQEKFQLNGVVVSSNRNEVNRKEAVTVVNVITPLLFENTNSSTLAQGLSYIPGLRVESNCQNCGFQQVRINGLEGPYSQILIDSRAIFSSLAGVYGIEQIPTNMIERVEVVRGGGSALFGSNAIAGVVNIITKEPISNSVTISNVLNFIGGKSTDNNLSFNASIVSEDQKAGIMLFGSSRIRNPYDHNGDGFTEIGKINLKNIGFRAYYKPSLYSKLSFEYHTIGEFRRGGNELDLPPHETDITEQTNHEIHSGSVKYDLFSKNMKHRFNLFSSFQKIDRESYYGAGKDPNAYGLTNDFTYVGGVQYDFKMDTLFFMPANLTIGAEFSTNSLHDEMLGYGRVLNQTVNVASIFLQNEWKKENLSILIGARIDKHNLIKKPILSPRMTFRYAPFKWVNFRANYATGFRAPQTFDEDLHLSAVAGNVAIISIDPHLKPEISNSISSSLEWYIKIGEVKANILVEGFYTHLGNVFILEQSGLDAEGNLLLTRKNGSGAVVKGFNMELNIIPNQKIQFQMGFTFQNSHYSENEVWSENPNLMPQRRMFKTPNQYGFLTASYDIFKNFSLSLSGIYTGSMLMQHVAGYIPEDVQFETPSFIDLSLKGAYTIKITNSVKIQLNGGIQNIFNSYQKDFDLGKLRDAGYIYGPSLPRTYFFGLKFMM
ncbi:MAG: TonB-dependent receptor [Bacteroidetes bacterium HGW-Bacteroidetes-19]|nr:MAG: TonB-dependent receptor [Bacteroidetes bacterium HGW-Bacteroidetes-19]